MDTNYKIIELNIEDDQIAAKVCRLIEHAFGFEKEMEASKLYNNTSTESKANSLYLGAVLNDEIIGFNAFIGHTLHLNGEEIYGFQSCWTASSKLHRGKGIFSNLINKAKEILASRQASFIFGFPNSLSQPIFVKKLDFKEFPSIKLQIPKVPGLQPSYFKSNLDSKPNSNDLIFQDNTELIKLKQQEYGKDIVVVKHEENLIWGKILTKHKFGLSMSFFSVGGIEVVDPSSINQLIQSVFQQTKSKYIEIVCTDNQWVQHLSNKFKTASTNDLILFNLDSKTEHISEFLFFSGIKDVF